MMKMREETDFLPGRHHRGPQAERSGRYAGAGRSAGFTMIEILVFLVFFGLTATMLLYAFGSYSSGIRKATTNQALDMSKTAIAAFQGMYNRYPCPADPTLPTTDPNYGREDCATPLVSIPGARDTDFANNGFPAPNNNDPVLVGAVPFRTILDPDGNPLTKDGPDVKEESGDAFFFSERHSVDGWGNKLTYAVSLFLTNDSTYDNFHGTIAVYDESNVNLIMPSGSVHFFLLSHGPDGRGAWARNGAIGTPCNYFAPPAGPPGQPVYNETRNCAFAIGASGVFISGLGNSVWPFYYDDVVRYVARSSSSLWQVVDTVYLDGGTPEEDFAADDLYIPQIQNTNPGNIGVRVPAGPTTISNGIPSQKLHIGGNLRTEMVYADRLCDESESDCMPVSVLAGAGMLCPPIVGRPLGAVTAIENSNVICAQVFPDSGFDYTCPTYITGISNLGNVECSP